MSPLPARFSAFKPEFSVGDEHVPARAIWMRYRALGLWVALLVFLAGWMALHWYQTALRVRQFYNPLPTWDYWRVPSDYLALKALHVGVLWRQHNEHRILFPEIVFQLDMFLFHGRMLLPLTFSLLCYIGVWMILTYCIWSDKALTTPVRTGSALLTGGIMGWQGSSCVLAGPFLLQWTLSQIGVLLALLSLWGTRETGRGRYLIACISCATVVLYSSGNGLLFWPVLIAAALVLGIRRGHLYALMLSAAVSVGCFFLGYQLTSSLNMQAVLAHPLYALEFVAAYIAMPFSAIKAPMFGVWVGVSNICVAIGLAVITLRKRWTTRVAVVFLGSYVFTLLSAVLTGLGRMVPGDPFFVEAKATRYLTMALVNWAVLILFLIWVAGRSGWKVLTPRGIIVITLVLCLLGLPKLRWWLRGNINEFTREKTAAIAIENGVTDPIVLRMVFPDPGFVMLFLPMLRIERLSVFYHAHLQPQTTARTEHSRFVVAK